MRIAISGVVVGMLALASGGCHTSPFTPGNCATGACGSSCAACQARVAGPPAGPLAGLHGNTQRGPQSHVGSEPGPASGPPAPTVAYPYYTTRGPRDFLAPNPPSPGR